MNQCTLCNNREMARKEGIERFEELYAYLEKHEERYFVEKLLCEGKCIICKRSISFE